MTTTGFLAALLLAVRAADPPPLAELAAEYKSLGLPVPPAEAKLVSYTAGWRENDSKIRSVGFEVGPGTRTESPTLLTGVLEWKPSWNAEVERIEPTPAAVQGFDLDAEDSLLLAVQCQLRGWTKLADHLALRSRGLDGNESPREMLVTTAWGYWQRQVTAPGIDRRPVAARLHELVRRQPKFDTPRSRALLRSLDLALIPGTAKPGTVEAMIDALVDESGVYSHGVSGRGEAYWRVARLGFDAVPTLIDHLGDERLTRAVLEGFNNFRSLNLRVQHVVSDLLEELAGEYLDRGTDEKSVGSSWLRRQQGYPVRRVAARAWWERVRNGREDVHLLSRVLLSQAIDNDNSGVSPHLIRVIEAKYPSRLPGLYRSVLESRPWVRSWELAEAVRRAPIPIQKRLDLLTTAAGHPDLGHRLPALTMLRELDQERCDTALLATLRTLPTDTADNYSGCGEAAVAYHATLSGDPRVWTALERAARRASVGLRLEMLGQLWDPEAGHRTERLRLLAAFLNDETVRDAKADKRFDGLPAGDDYPRLAVRDFAAVMLARLLGQPVPVKPDRTAAEWAAVREQVRERLEREPAGR
jgi:hypothetical protein